MGSLTAVLLFIELLPKRYAKFGPKSQLMTKYRMSRATNLHQTIKLYATLVPVLVPLRPLCTSWTLRYPLDI